MDPGASGEVECRDPPESIPFSVGFSGSSRVELSGYGGLEGAAAVRSLLRTKHLASAFAVAMAFRLATIQRQVLVGDSAVSGGLLPCRVSEDSDFEKRVQEMKAWMSPSA